MEQVKVGQVWTNGVYEYRITDIKASGHRFKCSAESIIGQTKYPNFGTLSEDLLPVAWDSSWRLVSENATCNIIDGNLGSAINDHVCPSCQNKRCSKSEKTCWRCGNPL
jgi:hypothetical protein